MYTTLAGAIGQLRIDLNDPFDPANSRYADDELTRALERALDDYTRIAPRVQFGLSVAVVGSLFDVATVTLNPLGVQRIEDAVTAMPLPFERYLHTPTSYMVRFVPPIADGTQLRVWAFASHIFDGLNCTIHFAHRETLLVGAQGYALQGLSTRSVGRANVPPAVQQQSARESAVRLRDFASRLQNLMSDTPSSVQVPWGLTAADAGGF